MVSKEEQEKMAEQIVDFRCFMAATLEWRKEQGQKMDILIKDVEKISEKFEKLPCKERAYIPQQINAIWCFIGAICIAIITQWLKK